MKLKEGEGGLVLYNHDSYADNICTFVEKDNIKDDLFFSFLRRSLHLKLNLTHRCYPPIPRQVLLPAQL